jgi:hypothetical protein
VFESEHSQCRHAVSELVKSLGLVHDYIVSRTLEKLQISLAEDSAGSECAACLVACMHCRSGLFGGSQAWAQR